MKKLALSILGLLFLLAVMLATIFTFRVALIQRVAPGIASNYDLEIHQMDLAQINMRKIHIPYLEATQYLDNMLIHVALKDLEMRMDLWQGEATNIDDVRAKSIHIKIEVDGTNNEAKAAGQSKNLQQLFDVLPALTAKVDRLDIQYRERNKDVASLRGKLVRSENSIAFSGQAHALDLPALALNASIVGQNLINFYVADQQSTREIIHLDGELVREDDWLNVKASGGINLSAASQYMHKLDYALPIKILSDDSRFELQTRLDLAASVDQIVDTSSLKIMLATAMQASMIEQNLAKLDLNIQTHCAVDALTDVQCKVLSPISAKAKFLQVPDWFGSVFSWNENIFVMKVKPKDELLIMGQLDKQLFSFAGDASINLMAANQLLTLDLDMNDVNLNYNRTLQGYAKLASVLNMDEIVMPMDIKNAHMIINGEAKISEKNLTVSLLEDAAITLQDVRDQEISTSKIELSLLDELVAQYDLTNSGFNLKPTKISLLSNDLFVKGNKINHDDVLLELKKTRYRSGDLEFQGQVQAEHISVQQQDLLLEFEQTNINLSMRDNKIVAHGAMQIPSQTSPVKFSANYNVNVQAGGLNASVTAFAPAQDPVVAQLIANSGLPIEIDSGGIDVNLIANFANHEDAQNDAWLEINLNNFNGNYAQNAFADLNGNFEIYGAENWELIIPASVSVAEINVGVPISDFSIKFDRFDYQDDKQPLIAIRELKAQALEGSIYAENVVLDFNQDANEFSIFLFRLSLEELIALNQSKDLLASGVFDGELPINLMQEGISINNGWIKADEKGGAIKYNRAKEILAGNPNLEIVAELLKDFQYNQMSAGIDLQPDGKVLLATKLHGRSPDSQINSQVNLNFNVELNVWKFLESLRLLTRIDEDIGNQILH